MTEADGDLHRRIGARIVDDEQLEVSERLVEHALHRLADVRFAVVNGHEHRHSRCHRTAVVARRSRRKETAWRGRFRNR